MRTSTRRIGCWALVCVCALLAAAPIADAKEPLGTIEGVVVDAAGEPVAGARVYASKMNPSRWSFVATPASLRRQFASSVPARVSATTNAAGRFLLVGLEDARGHHVTAWTEAPLATATTTARARVGVSEAARLTLRPGRRLTGRLVDAAGHGVRGSVSFYVHERTRSFSGGHTVSHGELVDEPTDEDGRFACVVPADAWLRLQAVAPGVGERTMSLAQGSEPLAVEVALRRAQGCSAAGQVTDAKGAPIAGALVEVRVRVGSDLDWHGNTTAVTRTDAKGRWSVDGLPEGTVTHVAGWASGHIASAHWNVDAPVRRARPLAVDLVLGSGGRIVGRVLDSAGKPVAGASVLRVETMAMGYTPPGDDTVTDEQGRYAFEDLALRPGVIVIRAKGWTVPFEAGHGMGMLGYPFLAPKPGQTVDMHPRLVRGQVMRGRVVNAEGEPVAGATIGLEMSRGTAVSNDLVRAHDGARSDAAGRFDLMGIAAGTNLKLSIQAEGYQTLSTPISVADVPGTTPQQFTLQPATIVGGRVLRADGSPVVGATVGLSPGWIHGTTDKLGAFRLPATGGGTQRVHLGPSHTPLASIVVGIVRGTSRDDLVLRWPAGGSLGGTVVDEDDEPIADITVSVTALGKQGLAATTRTDSTGRWRIDDAPAGRYKVYADRQFARAVEMGVGDLETKVVHVAEPVAFFDGRLLGPDGMPVPTAQIAVGFAHDGPHVARTTAQVLGGRFRARVPPGAKGGLKLSVQNARDAHGRPLNALPLRLGVPSTSPKDLTIRLEKAGSVRGQVLDGDARPVSGIVLHLYLKDRKPNALQRGPLTAYSDADGRFHFTGVVPGVLSLRLGYAPNLVVPPPQDVQAGQKGIVVSIKRLRTIAGTVVGLDGLPVAGATVHLGGPTALYSRRYSTATTNHAGKFTLTRIPDGVMHTVSAVPPYEKDGETVAGMLVNIEAGSHDLVIKLRQGVTIAGTVLGTDGEAVIDCRVSTLQLKGADGKPLLRGSQTRVATTDAKGRFVLRVFEPGCTANLRFTMRREAKHHYFRKDVVSVKAGDEVKITLDPGFMIRGSVTGAPMDLLKGLRITAVPVDTKTGTHRMKAYLDGTKNTFAIGPLRRGAYKLLPYMRSSGRLFYPREILTKAPAKEVVIKVSQAWYLHGTVTGTKVPRCKFEWYPNDDNSVLGNKNPGPKGEFRLGRMRDVPGTLLVRSKDGTHLGLRTNIRPSESPITVKLVPGTTISGRIDGLPGKVRSGRIVAKLGRIEIGRSIPDDGWFESALLPPGDWTFRIECSQPRGTFVFPEDARVGKEHVLVRFMPK